MIEYSNVPTAYGPDGSGNDSIGNSCVNTADALVSSKTGTAPSTRQAALVARFFNDASTSTASAA